jgi:hypothetical protein
VTGHRWGYYPGKPREESFLEGVMIGLGIWGAVCVLAMVLLWIL